MHLLSVQLNHPGTQKPYKLGRDYQIDPTTGDIYRLWNTGTGSHFRKFIQNKGEFINPKLIGTHSISAQKSDSLFFWGEWEGLSKFHPFKLPPTFGPSEFPNGIHEPIHYYSKGAVYFNTDPYVFGDRFLYSICKMTGKMQKLSKDSLIIFGTTYPSLGYFYVDTVFVISDIFQAAFDVCSAGGSGYSKIFKEATLQQLPEVYSHPCKHPGYRIYQSKSWKDDSNYFSFVPCKIQHNVNGFERLKIDISNPILGLSIYPGGKKYLANPPRMIWNEIVKHAVSQGFELGVWFEEPPIHPITFLTPPISPVSIACSTPIAPVPSVLGPKC